MEASETTTPVATETPAPDTAPAPETPETPETPAATPEPDWSESTSALERRIEALEGPQQEQGGREQLHQALSSEPEVDLSDEQIDKMLAEMGYGNETAPEPESDIPQWGQEVLDYLRDREARAEEAELNKFAQDNPDIEKPEILQEVIERVTEIAERAGAEHIRRDPVVLGMVLAEVRAKQAGANEVPAEEARDQGASIETDASASAGGEMSEEQQAVDRILKSGPKSNTFA